MGAISEEQLLILLEVYVAYCSLHQTQTHHNEAARAQQLQTLLVVQTVVSLVRINEGQVKLALLPLLRAAYSTGIKD